MRPRCLQTDSFVDENTLTVNVTRLRRKLENAGLSVPDDVSVVGIDDALEGLVPHNRLTTLRFDLRGVGKLAFEAAIGESSSIEAIHVPSTLVERSTVRDIRG